MSYINLIDNLISKVDPDLINLSEKETRNNVPTQVSSNFLTNKEQGDWAEKTLLNVININSKDYIAVKYGLDNDIIAGEDGFKEYYKNYKNELDTIGKRPDILIFHKNDYNYNDYDISKFDIDTLDKLVPLAKCGIEVRSSAFLIEKYDNFMYQHNLQLINNSLNIRDNILNNYSDLLKSKDDELFKIIKKLSQENIHVISYKTPSWRSSYDLTQLSLLLKELKDNIKQITKRTFLSITPKVEDIKLVYNWIKKYNVPHFYIQVFFDKAYGISFEKILKLIGNPSLEDVEYFIEKDVKNQNKTTIKINANKQINIIENITLPHHYCQMKEMTRGRLLYYVKFQESLSIINGKECEKLFGFKLI